MDTKQEYKNIWKFLKSEDIGLAQMGLSMAKGISKGDLMDNDYFDFRMRVYKKSNAINDKSTKISHHQYVSEFGNEIDYLTEQVRVWYWFSVVAIMAYTTQESINVCLEKHNDYKIHLAEVIDYEYKNPLATK